MRIWLAACFAGVGIVTAAAVFGFVRDSSNRVISERSTELAVGRTVRDADRIGATPAREIDEALPRSPSETYSAWAFDVKGRLVSVGGGSEVTLADIDDREVAVAQALTGGRYLAELPKSVTVVAVPIFRKGKVNGALLTHSTRPASLQRSFERLQVGSLRALAISVGIALLAGGLVAGLIAARVKRLARAAGELASGRFDTALERGWRDEIGDLERALDAMRAALKESFAVLTAERDRLSTKLRRDQAEREFISNAAHELRNPIAGISSAIEVLRDGAKDDPTARDHFLSRLADDAERMTRLTQSLLTLARAESRAPGEGDVADVEVAVQEAVKATERPEGVELKLEIEPDLAVRGDPVLLRQVIIGLLSNAYKHTAAPGTVSLGGRRTQEGEVLIEVSDTGSGIPSEELDRVFERFYRGKDQLDREGFGLGLAIAKRMVGVMGGEIGVNSREGEGASFWVRLVAAKPTTTPVA